MRPRQAGTGGYRGVFIRLRCWNAGCLPRRDEAGDDVLGVVRDGRSA